MAATDLPRSLAAVLRRLGQALAALLPGLLATGAAKAVDLPENKAEALLHVYDGGGVTATGPAVLVRKNIADKVSLSATLYVDIVSNASIDVVTTASPFRETRNALDLGLDYVVRDTAIKFGLSSSREPDYNVSAFSLDASQEVFGGMTTVSLGFTRASDKVRKHNAPEFADAARHWHYRLGATQIISPTWLASLNFEAISDSGYLGSPYRVARVFGAAVPERNPRTRTSRALKLRASGHLGAGQAVHAEARYFWDTWNVRATTAEAGYSRAFGPAWLADGFLRLHHQSRALFYSDNASAETLYLSRNRQLSSFNTAGVGGKLSHSWRKVPGQYEVKLNGAYEFVHFKYRDFTDIRTGQLYSFNAHVLQLFVSATY